MTEYTAIQIEDATRGQIIASAEVGTDVLVHEGCYYFAPDKVDMKNLKITERIFICPYKGKCYWIDLVNPRRKTLHSVAWVYPDPNQGFEHLKGRIGFYPGIRNATIAHLEGTDEVG